MAKRRKNTPPNFIINVQKIKEEQRIYYEGLREVERLKKKLQELEKVEEKTQKVEVEEVLSVLTSSADAHPGTKVFKKKRRFQCFTLDTLKMKNNEFDYEDFLILLKYRSLDNETLSAKIMDQIFYIMSIERDVLVCDTCCQLLVANISNWVPKFEDIFKIFLNWGASYESLGLSNFERSIVFPNYVYLQPVVLCDEISEFGSTNINKVFSYIGEIVKRSETYKEIEILILLKCILKILLDQKFNSFRTILQDCVFSCIESIKDWNPFKIMNISAIIHDRKEHFHNQVAIVMEMIPKTSKCKDISSCLALAVLRFLINSEAKYTYPYSDADVLDLMKSIKINVNSSEDLYKLYMIIHLLNHIVYNRNMIEVHQDILQDLKNIVDDLKWEVVKSKKTFDADLLRGRMSYCSTLWSLFRRNEMYQF